MGYFGTRVPEQYFCFRNELWNQVFHNVKFGGANILWNDPFRNSIFCVTEPHVQYTSCGMGGSVYKLRNGWFRNTLGGVQTYCGTAHSVTCIRIRIDVVEWVVPNKNSSKIPHSQIAFPRNLNYTTNLTIDNTCLKWL